MSKCVRHVVRQKTLLFGKGMEKHVFRELIPITMTSEIVVFLEFIVTCKKLDHFTGL